MREYMRRGFILSSLPIAVDGDFQCVCVCPKKEKKMIMNVLFVCLFFRNCLLLMLRKERERNGTGIEGIPGKG